MDLIRLRGAVENFANIWFPNDGSHVKFWFRARDKKYSLTITELCEKSFSPVDEITGLLPTAVLEELEGSGWSSTELVELAVLLDQMPRNALAVNYGRYKGLDPRDVKGAVDDSFSLAFALVLLERLKFPITNDERLICFFSLVFRHSNDLDRAKMVLNTLRLSSGALPPLASKFWAENEKRAEQSLSSTKPS